MKASPFQIFYINIFPLMEIVMQNMKTESPIIDNLRAHVFKGGDCKRLQVLLEESAYCPIDRIVLECFLERCIAVIPISNILSFLLMHVWLLLNVQFQFNSIRFKCYCKISDLV